MRARAADAWLIENEGVSILKADLRHLQDYLFSTSPVARNRNNIRQALIGFFAFLVARGVQDVNHAELLPRLGEPELLPKPLEVEDARLVWKAAKASEPFERALIAVLLFEGLRNSEVRLLEWRDVEREWLVIRWEIAKRAKERRVPLHPETKAALSAWRSFSHEARWVFPSPRFAGRPISKTYMRNVLYEIGRRAGIERLHPHQFRHTFATEAMEATDGDTRTVQELMGHADASTTAIYTRVRPERLKAAVTKLEF